MKLDRVVDSLPDRMRALLGEEPTRSFRDAYMAAKNADCEMPAPDELRDACAWGARLFRLWTASEVGVPAGECNAGALALQSFEEAFAYPRRVVMCERNQYRAATSTAVDPRAGVMLPMSAGR